ncbi:MAG: hypothetical protein U0528_14905 [Anaerolineae bacterium]
MSQVPTNIFRKYDIRGSVTPEKPELTPDIAYLVGKDTAHSSANAPSAQIAYSSALITV